MPSLVLFGRRWGVGSDDFVIPSLIDFIFRIVWLFASVIILWKNYELFECTTTRQILFGFLGILQCCILVDVILGWKSSKGTIMDAEEVRRNVPTVVYLRILAELVLISWNIFTSIWYWTKQHACQERDETLKFIFGLITFNWILLGIQFFFVIYTFDFVGAVKTQNSPCENQTACAMELPKTHYSRLCRRRLTFCCCLLCECKSQKKMEMKHAFREVARMFASQFGDDDLVHSDVIAGLAILATKHREEKHIRRVSRNDWKSWNHGDCILSEPKSGGSTEWSKDWRSFNYLSHFLKYASAAYGWKIVFVQQRNPLWKLANHWKLSSCLPCNKFPIHVEGDSCSHLDTAGLNATLQAPYQDIAYVSFKNHLFETPFFVALDHETKSVVVSIRGSFSFNDFLLDVVCLPVPIPGYPPDFKGHRGILNASIKVRDTLRDLKILPSLLEAHPEYNLVLTGHSLGSACATLLGLFLLQEYPNLKCYSYSPPGGLLSMEAANFCDSFVTSLTYGDDIITRAGIHQMEQLKLRVVNALWETRIPKHKILMKGISCCNQKKQVLHYQNRRSDNHSPDNGVVNQETPPDISIQIPSSYSPTLRKNSEISSGTKYSMVERMYPPGKIIHIRRNPRRKIESGANGPKWVWRWADRTDFDEIIISKGMILDHLPIIFPKSIKYLEKF